MEKKNIDWSSLGFGYVQTDYRYVSKFKDGAWDAGELTTDPNVTLNECAGVFQYAQTVFEGMKAYTTEDGHIVTFRPDLNAERMANSAKRLEMPVFPEDRFVDAIVQTVKANAAYVPPYGSGATLYVRPYMMGTNPVIGVKPADEYMFRVFTTPVGPYFKGGAKPITIRVSDFDRAAPHGTGHIKAGLNYAMSLQCFPVAEQVVGVAAQHTGGKVNHPVAVGEIGFHIIKVETGGKGIGGLAGEMVFGDGISVVRNQFHSLQEVTLHFPVHFFQRAALVTGRHGGFHVFHIGDSQRFGGMSVISIAEDSCQHEMAVGTAHQCFTALRVERCRISFLLYRLECHVGG